MPNSKISKKASLTRMQTLIAILSKRLNLSWEAMGYLAIFLLKTEQERAQFALWLDRNQMTDMEQIIAKAQEIAQTIAS